MQQLVIFCLKTLPHVLHDLIEPTIGAGAQQQLDLLGQKEIANALLANGIDTSFSNLDSLMGHDAFLVDYNHFNPHIKAYFDRVWYEDRL